MSSPKYERTLHLPWSLGRTSDDKVMTDVSGLLDTPLVITEKMDGSNVCMETYKCFARTHSGPPSHASFDAFKQLHSMCKSKIPEYLQIFGEWCYAFHSLPYDHLPGSFFLMFAVRDTRSNVWMSWEEVELWAQELNIPTVPVLELGTFQTEDNLQETTTILGAKPSFYGPIREGVVVRVITEFHNSDFPCRVGKFVRANHVQTSEHWSTRQIVRNKIAI